LVYFSPVEFFIGFWSLATGLWQLVSCRRSLATCLWVSQQQEASSKKPCFANYLRDATLADIIGHQCPPFFSAEENFLRYSYDLSVLMT
jgi:hypothetical protein